ncbi:MAG: hypothetical protein CL940_05040 [Deltaproteobacteria bacterium]|nr:hypothetical protein [Deltaproteobacteria bacterium]
MNRTLSILMATTFLVLSGGVWAAPAEDDTVPGELHVNTNSEYVKAEVNGEPWDSVEYANRGKRMLIKGIDRGPATISFRLIPSDDTLAPISLEVPSKDFKRKVRKRVLYYIAKRKVKFKAGAAPAPETAPEEKPGEEKPPKVVPTQDPDDL